MTTLVRDRVLELLETSDLVEPRDLARKVYDDLVDETEVREALLEVLPQYVRVLLSQHRRDSRRARSSGRPNVPPSIQSSGGRPADSVAPSSTDDTSNHASGGEGATNLSPRWQRAAQGFRERYYPGEWKFLGDCTRADVARLVTDYRGRAAQNSHYAERFEILRRRMERDGVTLVAELPEAWVVQVLHEELPSEIEGEEGVA